MPEQESAPASRTFTVTEADTAEALGSGSLPVLGTPGIIAWCEAVSLDVANTIIKGHQTTVGTVVELLHRAPSPVGASVHVQAELSDEVAGNLVFDVRAHDDEGNELAVGTVTRAVVDIDRFMERWT